MRLPPRSSGRIVRVHPDDSAPLRRIPDATFSGDTGEVPPAVAAAMAAYAADHARYPEALAVLASERLLVPVVAVLGEVELDEAGLAHDKSSDMAAVRLAAQAALQDGAAALVVDVAGPATLVVEGEDLRGLALGWTLARVGDRP